MVFTTKYIHIDKYYFLIPDGLPEGRSFDAALRHICGYRQTQIHVALQDAECLMDLCHKAARRLGFKKYKEYIRRNPDEIF